MLRLNWRELLFGETKRFVRGNLLVWLKQASQFDVMDWLSNVAAADQRHHGGEACGSAEAALGSHPLAGLELRPIGPYSFYPTSPTGCATLPSWWSESANWPSPCSMCRSLISSIEKVHSSAKAKPYTTKIVQWIRWRYQIPPARLKKPEELTVQQVARQFGVSDGMVYDWIEHGVLRARRLNERLPYWITLNAADAQKLRDGCTTQAGFPRCPEGDWSRCIMKPPSENYMIERRKGIDRKYDCRYFRLTQLFGRLLHER